MTSRAAFVVGAGALGLAFVAALQARELRREAAELKANPRAPAVVPADMPLPRAVVEAGGHDASGEGRR